MFKQQEGNVFFALFAAVALVGVLGASVSHLMSGSARSVSDVTRHKLVQSDMAAATALLSKESLARPAPDCDGDGTIEPLAFAAAGTPSTAPVGGGHIPANIGTNKSDPWGSRYGYCVWDHGTKVKDAGCGATGRLSGGVTTAATTIAIISAGPDKIFQTGCADWVSDSTPVVNKPSGSDDIFRAVPYNQFLMPRATQTQLQELPDEACTPQAIGLMRRMLGNAQVCTETGWTDVGSAAQASGDFADVVNADLDSIHTSNAISFTGFFGKKNVMATDGASLIINGDPSGTSAQIAKDDQVQLTAAAASTPETELQFRMLVSGVEKIWKITTRDAHPASLTIQPNSASLAVTGPGSPAYSAPHGFLVRNTGEAATAVMNASGLTNTTNFAFHADGSYQGDGCAGKTLAHDETCLIDIRALASGGGSYNGILSVSDGNASVDAALSVTASGWTCPLPWGGTAADGDVVTAYENSTVPFGNSCVSAQRTCTGGALSGPSYTNQSCNVAAALNCTQDGVTVNHNASRYFYSATSATDCNSIRLNRACSNGNLDGSNAFSHANCTNTGIPCTLDGVTRQHGETASFYDRTSVPYSQSCSSYRITRTCNNGTFDGSTSYNKGTCTRQPCNNWAWVAQSPGCAGGPGNNYMCHGGGPYNGSPSSATIYDNLAGGDTSPTCNQEHKIRIQCNWKASPCTTNYRKVVSDCKCLG